jgi:hypothetical protein
MHAARQLEAELAGTMLAGREVRSVPIPGTDELGLEVSIDPEELPAAWEAARGLVLATGRWPVAVADPGDYTYDRFYYRSKDETPAVVLERAAGLSVDDAIWTTWSTFETVMDPGHWDRTVIGALADTRARVGDAPSEAEVRRVVPVAEEVALERLLLEWEEARQPTLEREKPYLHDPAHAYEYCCAIAFLPTAQGANTPAYTSFFNAEGYGHERLVVALRHWQRRFGAEVVASTGTMIVLTVGRPPVSIDDAWQLAREISQLSDHPDSWLRERARSLLDSPDWVLISRP